MTDDRHRSAVQARNTRNDGGVIGKGAVSVELMKVGEQAFNVIQRVRTLRVPGQLRYLPCIQLGEDRARKLVALFLQILDLVPDVELGGGTDAAQLLDLSLELGDGLLELEEVQIHPQILRYLFGGRDRRFRCRCCHLGALGRPKPSAR